MDWQSIQGFSLVIFNQSFNCFAAAVNPLTSSRPELNGGGIRQWSIDETQAWFNSRSNSFSSKNSSGKPSKQASHYFVHSQFNESDLMAAFKQLSNLGLMPKANQQRLWHCKRNIIFNTISTNDTPKNYI